MVVHTQQRPMSILYPPQILQHTVYMDRVHVLIAAQYLLHSLVLYDWAVLPGLFLLYFKMRSYQFVQAGHEVTLYHGLALNLRSSCLSHSSYCDDRPVQWVFTLLLFALIKPNTVCSGFLLMTVFVEHARSSCTCSLIHVSVLKYLCTSLTYVKICMVFLLLSFSELLKW